jgi:NAD(P)-dependent dehydrogenase (short-subunit alcohol dehydrogenase family)
LAALRARWDEHVPRVLDQFRLDGRTAVITGGGGALGAVFARALAEAGARVWVTDLDLERAQRVAVELKEDGLAADALAVDVLDRAALDAAAAHIGAIDVLVNSAGGNRPEATTSPHQPFFDLPLEAVRQVFDLNFFGGALLPAQAFGRVLAQQPGGGVILNISSMAALRPLTSVGGYGAAKAAVSNFTQWLATHMAREYNPRIRVNALAPGFFLTDQNRYLLLDPATGDLTPRGQTVVAHTPMGRLGEPADLAGAVVWLCSDAARFVTGVVLPVDGGFAAFSGV